MIYWKQWKKIKTRIEKLKHYGIDEQKAYEYANIRKGYWRIADSPILHKSLNNNVIKGFGYLFFSDYYKKVTCVNGRKSFAFPTKNTPYTERYVRWCERSVSRLMANLLLDYRQKN